MIHVDSEEVSDCLSITTLFLVCTSLMHWPHRILHLQNLLVLSINTPQQEGCWRLVMTVLFGLHSAL